MKLNVRCLLMFFLAVVTLSSCSKDDFNAEEQAKKDDALIVDFIAKNNIQATKHSSGLYYQVISEGTGASVTAASTVGVNYVGKFLNGSQFEKSESIVTFPLSQVIQGWTIGVPLIKVGGRIRLIIPSGLAYGNRAQGPIAKNTVLDFTIDLIHAQ